MGPQIDAQPDSFSCRQRERPNRGGFPSNGTVFWEIAGLKVWPVAAEFDSAQIVANA
jgi:hypothetical protein